MKPTLNEEIGMSKQGIDYVNSLEVKDCQTEIPKTPIRNTNFILNEDVCMKALKNDIPDYIESQRIKRQGRNALICVAIIIIVTLIVS